LKKKEITSGKKYNQNVQYLKNNYSTKMFYQKQEMWRRNVEGRREKIREKQFIQEYEDCTFKPEIAPIEIKDDDEFISKNINQIMGYVNKRKKVLDSHKEHKEYMKKKFPTGENFVIRQTKPKEFVFNAKPKGHLKHNDSNNLVIDVLKYRELTMKDFFVSVEGNSNENLFS